MDYLSNRRQAVIANNEISEICEVISGVPQGSILGPLLFLILIDNIDKNITKSSASIFADDTKATKEIKSIEDAEDLQKDLEILYNWQDINNMQFNDTKFQLLQFGKDKNKHEYWYMTPDCANPIIPSENVRDLGVTVDYRLTYKDHINEVCNKVKKKTGWLLRTFHNRDADFMKFL